MNKRWVYGLLAGAAGAYLLLRPGGLFTPLKPAPVTEGEDLTAKTYRVTSVKRAGMAYSTATRLKTGEISFRATATGTFTRNVLKQGDRLWAEIQPQ